MKKTFFLVCSFLLAISNNSKAQSIDWKYQTNDPIFKYEVPSDRVILIHGESNGEKVVNSKRIFPSVTALHSNTGEKVWGIANPIEMMGVSEKEKNLSSVAVKMRYVKKNSNYIRFGHLLVIDSKDGKVMFNPTAEGITEILYSKLFPEGIMATAKLNNERVQLFLSFSSWKIAWVKKETTENGIEKNLSKGVFNLMSTDPNAKKNIAIELAKSSLYNGNYIDGNYLMKTEEGVIENFNLTKGTLNWTYKPQNQLKQHLIAKDQARENTLVYLSTHTSSNKSGIEALDYKTGHVLWKKDLNYKIDLLQVVDESLSILAIPATNVLGKRYYQIYDKQGQALLKEQSLKAFGTGISEVLTKNNKLIIIAKSSQSGSSNINTPFGKVSTSKTGTSTKFPEFVNIINLDTKEFLFDRRIKTKDIVKEIFPLEKGLFIIENNRAYLVDYASKKEIGKPIKASSRLIFMENDKDEIYVTAEKASSVYRLNKTTGETKQIINLKKNSINFIHELLLIQDDILISGIDKKENLVLLKIDANGNTIYNKTFPSSNYKKSWAMPLLENNLYLFIKEEKNIDAVGLFDVTTGKLTNKFSNPIEIKGKIRKNTGSYYVHKKNGTIYNIPQVSVKSPIDKKSRTFNSSGIIIAKRY
jgi:outer membrane protein assembly factor BamB